jgi:hypothetical protein
MTVGRAIAVMSSQDRQPGSVGLFTILDSHAREHIGLHVDSKDVLARSIGHHRGEIANAREVFNDAKLGKDRNAWVDMNADASKALHLPVPEKYLGLSL